MLDILHVVVGASGTPGPWFYSLVNGKFHARPHCKKARGLGPPGLVREIRGPRLHLLMIAIDLGLRVVDISIPLTIMIMLTMLRTIPFRLLVSSCRAGEEAAQPTGERPHSPALRANSPPPPAPGLVLYE